MLTKILACIGAEQYAFEKSLTFFLTPFISDHFLSMKKLLNYMHSFCLTHEGYFVVKQLVLNVDMKAFWFTCK